MTVTIDRSVPIQIEADGQTIRTRTRAEDVAGALGQEGIALLGKDRVEPALSTPIRSGVTLHVIRVRQEFAVEFDPIPFNTEWVPDPEVEIDNIRLVREGQVGLTKRRFRIVYENDQEVDRYLEDVWAAQPPITKTMAYGTKIIIRTMETPDGEIEYWRKMRVYTTSYTAATCGKPRDHPRYVYTRLGKWLTKGIVATDPTVIPLKTRLYVPGYGLAFAGDTGGGVKGKFVDLGFDEYNYESWHWWTDVYILTPVPTRDKIRWILPDMPKFPDRGRR
jgi:3D (Asp-Asp-Asp) domain-containing protein